MISSMPGWCRAGEGDAAIHHDPLAGGRGAEAIGPHVHADLADPAEGDEDQLVSIAYHQKFPKRLKASSAWKTPGKGRRIRREAVVRTTAVPRPVNSVVARRMQGPSWPRRCAAMAAAQDCGRRIQSATLAVAPKCTSPAVMAMRLLSSALHDQPAGLVDGFEDAAHHALAPADRDRRADARGGAAPLREHLGNPAAPRATARRPRPRHPTAPRARPMRRATP